MKTAVRTAAVILLVVAAPLGVAPAAVAEELPANDSFSSPLVLIGPSGDVVVDTTGATMEPGETPHAGVGEASVWFSWTAPQSGEARFSTEGSTFDTVLAAYTGDAVDALTEVASNDDFGGLQSRVTFIAVAGTTYAIAGSGFDGDTGTLYMEWAMIEPPEPATNDAFVDAITLEGESGVFRSSNELATMESGEPAHAVFGTNSVWFNWTASRESLITFDTVGSRFDTVLAVYRGTAVYDLDLVAEFSHTIDETRLSFVADEGIEYRVAVAGFNGRRGEYVLNYSATDPVPVPANDDFADATALVGTAGALDGNTDLATNEPGEPRHDRWGTRSVWFAWTAPTSGGVTFIVQGTGYESILGVYTGHSAESLEFVATDDGAVGGDRSLIVFPAQESTTYAIAVSGQLGRTGPFRFTWEVRHPPANDHFADREVLTGASGEVTRPTLLGTVEPSEPPHGNSTVWFSWTAPADGVVGFDTLDTEDLPLFSAFNTVISVYRGDALDALTPIAANDNASGGDLQSNVVFAVQAGDRYELVVSGGIGLFKLNWLWSEPVANDSFATPAVLDAVSGSLTATNLNATAEPDERLHDRFGYLSTWYSWTALENGIATFEIADDERVIAIYEGATLDGLTSVGESGGRFSDTSATVSFPAQAGHEYRIAVAGRSGARGPFTLDWSFRATPAPANDNFGTSEVISGAEGTVLGTNEGASTEVGEPADGGSRTASIWYSWTAPADGVVTFDTLGSAVDTVLAVYEGEAVGALRFRAANGLSAFLHAQVEVAVTAGETHRIVIFGFNGAQGTTSLNWSLRDAPAPGNDGFASAALLQGVSGSMNATNVGARPEPREQLHPGGSPTSVWYRFVAPHDGAFRFSTVPVEDDDETTFDTVLAVYTGAAVDSLNQVAANWIPFGRPAETTLRAEEGVTYWLAVAGARGEMGTFTLRWLPVTTPENDDFGAPRRLRGDAGRITQPIRFATVQPGEPRHAGQPGGASVWFRWQATSSGPVGFDTLDDFPVADTHMAVYTGRSLTDLVEVAANDDSPDGRRLSRVEWNAVRGTTYLIAVDTFYGHDDRLIVLSWRTAPENDDSDRATTIEGPVGRTQGNNLAATLEEGEPARIANGGASVWYRWTALRSGTFTFSVGGISFQPTISIYSGTGIGDLTLVAEADDPGVPLANNALTRFPAIEGTTYLIAIDGVREEGEHAEAGPFTLRWVGPAANDDFDDATALPGVEGSITGSYGSREIGEPDHGGDGTSVWYRWTPPRAGVAYVDTVGTQAFVREVVGRSALSNSLVAVYAIEPDGTRRFVAWNDDLAPDSTESALTFRAEPGVEYAIAVETSSAFGAGPVFKLNWAMAPANDDFEAAQPLPTAGGRIQSTNLRATLEDGEPLSGLDTEATVWFRWTAPVDGRLQVAVDDPDAKTVVDAYVGDDVDALTRVTEIDAPAGETQPVVNLPVRAGETYNIAVDGGSGPFALTWHLTAKALNAH